MTTTDTTTEHGIEITVKVLATGDTETTVIHPGQHALICVEPAYRSAVQIYQNGTTQITIRHRGTTPVATTAASLTWWSPTRWDAPRGGSRTP